jgi:hypothetical protein
MFRLKLKSWLQTNRIKVLVVTGGRETGGSMHEIEPAKSARTVPALDHFHRN